jgi:hypothetical protein
MKRGDGALGQCPFNQARQGAEEGEAGAQRDGGGSERPTAARG